MREKPAARGGQRRGTALLSEYSVLRRMARERGDRREGRGGAGGQEGVQEGVQEFVPKPRQKNLGELETSYPLRILC